MASNAGYSLLFATILGSVFMPTEYSIVASSKHRCQRQITLCGDFKAPKTDIGSFSCSFNNKKSCEINCLLTCPGQNKETWMTLSNRHFNKDLYFCTSGGQWKRRDTPHIYCVAKKQVKEVKQNFHHINDVNNLLSALMNTSYVYMAMASFYERADVALPGFRKLMTEIWQDEVKHTQDLMSYVNKRGGYISLADIPRPSTHDMLVMNSSRPGLLGLQVALNVAHDINTIALDLHKTVSSRRGSRDPHLKHYLEDGIISHKTDRIKKLADLIRQLKTFSDEDYDIGEYILDLDIGSGHSIINTINVAQATALNAHM